MFSLLHISSTECVEVLARFGYRKGRQSGGLTEMKRDANVVYVPESSLSPTLVRAILRTAKVDPFDFVRELEARLHSIPPAKQVAA